jgi:hypothetical protein
MMLRASEATKAAQPNQRKKVVAWDRRQFSSVLLSLVKTLLEWVYDCVMLEAAHTEWRRITYVVRAAVRTNVCRQRDGSAEAENNGERIHRDIHNRDAKLVDEGCGQEVQQCEQPPYSDEERVVDD